MELHRAKISSPLLIRPAKSSSGYWVNDELHTKSIIVTADTVIDDWRVESPYHLTMSDFQYFASFDAEIFILGTGEQLVFPDPKLFKPLTEQKCGYEIMNSRSACNTFNILLAEERRVVVALI